MIDEATREWLRDARGEDAGALVLPALHRLQDEHGHVSEEMLLELAELLDLAPSGLLAVRCFHPDFREVPGAQRRLALCTGLSCALRGADALHQELQGLAEAEASLELVRSDCLGACARAPAGSLDRRLIAHATGDRVRAALAESG